HDLVADAQLALLDAGDLVAAGVFEHEGLAQADRLAVDLVGPVPAVVLDPEVVADREQLLAHEEALVLGSVVVASQKAHAGDDTNASGDRASPGPGESRPQTIDS